MFTRNINYFLALFGLTIGIIFCFFVYPQIYKSQHVVLDADNWNALGWGIYKSGTLSYFPEIQPTLDRGPVYPLFLAAIFKITRGRLWPYNIQLAQCILLGLICLIVFWIAETLWNKKVAILSSLLCATYPFLIWYTSRIWIEILATFLFALLAASTLYLAQKPTVIKSVLVGLILGISILCKATFSPFIIILPLLLIYVPYNKISWRHGLCMIMISLSIIFSWTIRNYKITGKFIPVHLLAGYNLAIGDSIVENYSKAPFSLGTLWQMGFNEKIKPLQANLPGNVHRWEKEVFIDSELIKKSIDKYIHNPLFLLKKIALNSFLFWTLGENNKKTIVISLMQIPLLLLFILASIKLFKNNGLRTIYGVYIFLIFLYYIFHLPIFSMARFSIVLIPTIIMYASSIIVDNKAGPHPVKLVHREC